MNVLQVCHHFPPCVGGVERHVEDLCRNLIRLGHGSDVACLNSCPKKKERLPGSVEYQGIRIHRMSFLDLGVYKIAPQVLGLVRDRRYDLIHVHGMGFFSDYLAAAFPLHRKPMVLSTHGGIFHTPQLSALKSVYFYAWGRLVLRGFRRVIAKSRNDEELFSKISSRVTYIPYGIDLSDFYGIERSEEENSLLFVGRLSKNKGVDDLIRMVYYLKENVPDVRLYIVGGDWGGTAADLRRLVDGLGLEKNVSLVGEIRDRKELLGYYSRCGVFVSASRYEGFGISVLEAMASGMVVAVSNIEAFRNFVRHRENGFLLDFSDPEGAASAIAGILRSENASIRGEARKTSREYGWERIIKKIISVYEGCLE